MDFQDKKEDLWWQGRKQKEGGEELQILRTLSGKSDLGDFGLGLGPMCLAWPLPLPEISFRMGAFLKPQGRTRFYLGQALLKFILSGSKTVAGEN